jgi:hypothetical protein
MTTWKAMVCGVLGFALVAGCGQPAAPTKAPPKTEEDDHEHGPGPHKGTVIEFGGKYHGEFVVDHPTRTATVYILDVRVKNAVPISAKTVDLTIKSPAFQVVMKASPQEGDPAGKASRFVAVHDNFGKEQEFEGTVAVEIDGKPYAGDFKEEKHDHDHDHGKKK